jgi:hypothetical protein
VRDGEDGEREIVDGGDDGHRTWSRSAACAPVRASDSQSRSARRT